MSDWPKDEDGVVFFRTRQVAEAAAAKCNAAKLEPGVKWSVLEKDANGRSKGVTIWLQVQSARPTRAAILPISPGNPLRLLAMEIPR